MRIKYSQGDRIFDICNWTFLVMLIVITLYPILYTVSVSFSDPNAVMANKVVFLPVKFNLQAYKMVVNIPEFWISYKNTLVYVTLGVLFSLTGTTLLAYPLSKKRLLFRNVFSYYAAFTMYFSGGMVPWFLLMKELHFRNSLWGMVVPGSVSVFNAIILRTFFQNTIPEELEESAKIDGMGNFGILSKIYIPLSKPIYATLTLFVAVSIWNSYFTAILLLDTKDRFPLQVFLRNMLVSGEIMTTKSVSDNLSEMVVPATLRGAVIVVATLPIMMVYPFIQGYFIKGIMIGSIKG